MVTDFTKSIVADIRRINTQIHAKMAEVRELLGLFRVGLAITIGIAEGVRAAFALGNIEKADALEVDTAVAFIALTSIAAQITTLRQEITALREELAFDVGRLRAA